MLKALFWSCVGLFLFPGAAAAEEPITIEMVHYSAGKPLPKELADNAIASHGIEPGCKLTFLVQGTNLAGLNPESMKIHVLRTKAGKDVRSINGQPSYKDLSTFTNKTDGRYGKFTLELDASLFEDLSTLEIHGSIQVQVADGQEKIESESFATSKPTEFKLGDFQIKSLGEKPESKSFFQMASPADEEPQAGTITTVNQVDGSTITIRPGPPEPTAEELAKLPKNFWVQIHGPTEKVSQFRVLRKGAPLTYRSWSGGDNQGEYEFVLDERRGNNGAELLQLFGAPAPKKKEQKPDPAGDELLKQPVKVELTLWKNLRTVTIPFQHNVPKK